MRRHAVARRSLAGVICQWSGVAAASTIGKNSEYEVRKVSTAAKPIGYDDKKAGRM